MKTIKKKVDLPSGLKYVKYIVLFAIVMLCFTGVYSSLPSWSPWEVFSMLQALNFKLSGHLIGIIIFICILVGMAVCERFFCRFLCPMGAVFSLLPVISAGALHRDRQNCGAKCSACEKACPCKVKLPDRYSWDTSGECIMCQKCIPTCPKQNIKSDYKAIISTVVRTILLVVVMVVTGV
ncbi:putative iron-sulfur cluster binding protein YccM [Lachnospiraceae bacterium TWA4]|nr:putative iron-sulfur cluster binding protein YccM [Lachnospiraceae bacterium TWA4]